MGIAEAQGRLGTDRGPEARPITSLSDRIYGGLLRAYPAPFRTRYRDEMVQLFGDQLRDASAASGVGGVATTWFRTLFDLLSSAAGEHLRKDRTMAQSLATFEPTRSMRWLGLVGLAGGVLLLWAFISFDPFQTRPANMIRLITFALGQAAIALAFYRRQVLVAPRLALIATAVTVFAGTFYALWSVLALWVPNPYSGAFGALNLLGNGVLWLSAVVYGTAMLRIGAVWQGMPRWLGRAARFGAFLLLGSVFGWLGDDRLGLVDSGPYAELMVAVALFGVFLNGLGWVTLGGVLVFGNRAARPAA